MNIVKNRQGNELHVALEGRLDTVSAPEFEVIVKNELGGVELLVIDLVDLKYTSSAGLRTILLAQKTMNKQGRMILRNVGEEVMEVFEMTGLADLLTIE
ncbi:MAG: STAS domain-containing protein [Clostridia bacterium]|jgi:anti-sigma B factor antagonist|nr:STAS domain-containing protein [Clostridia bacterium]